MYDQSLERLIDAIIADGVITDQERKVVYKKAASLGIDRDEIEVYLEGKLYALKNAGNSKSGKNGTLRVCPNCGANIDSFVGVCPECGHEFKNVGAIESIDKFFNKLMSTQNDDEKIELIKNYPIPNSVEDLLEFISVAQSNAKDTTGIFSSKSSRWMLGLIVAVCIIFIMIIILKVNEQGSDTILFSIFFFFGPLATIIWFIIGKTHKKNRIALAWETKLTTSINKAKIICQNDSRAAAKVQLAMASYESGRKKRILVFSILSLITVVIIGIALLLPTSTKDSEERAAREELKRQEELDRELSKQQLDSLISNNHFEEAEDRLDSFDFYVGEATYYSYIEKIVTQMCRNGKLSQARKFAKRKSTHFKDNDSITGWEAEYAQKRVNKKLNEIIDSYN